MASEQSKPKRSLWGLRYSLRTLLILVTLFCIWLGVNVQAARNQRGVRQLIDRWGGRVEFDYKTSFGGRAPGPDLPRRLLGDDFFLRIVLVDLSGKIIDNEQLHQLSKLPRLRDVLLQHSNLDDEGVIHLVRLTHLREINVSDTAISTEGKRKLQASLTNTELLMR